VVVLRLDARRRIKSHVRAPVMSAAATMTPMAIPAFAPVDRPRDVCSTVTPEAVGAETVDVEVDWAGAHWAFEETWVQVYPELQQPPPPNVQYVCPCIEQLSGISVTMVLMAEEELLVLGTRHLPPLAQLAPYGQQPPPKDSAHR
jgi:hypothetical protein